MDRKGFNQFRVDRIGLGLDLGHQLYVEEGIAKFFICDVKKAFYGYNGKSNFVVIPGEFPKNVDKDSVVVYYSDTMNDDIIKKLQEFKYSIIVDKTNSTKIVYRQLGKLLRKVCM